MANLPEERVNPAPPFTYVGMDIFGLWYIKECPKELKRWGLIFTCLCSRAIHLETLNTMKTAGQHARQLNDEALRTLFTEAENFVNSRPLTVDNLSDPDFPEPNHLHCSLAKPKWCYHLLGTSRGQIFTQGNDGAEYNTYQNSFGLDGNANTVFYSRSARNGTASVLTVKLMISS